mmetsp:Transcript_591/g.839  ORF Transcript_591/g.839 Transcript_591/m.839 type:complete len:367 (+) Transcript_591:37-1137(+)
MKFKIMITPYAIIAHSLLCIASTASATGIYDGDIAEAHRYPYATSLQTDEGVPFCGGSLIAPDVILSAGHCQRGEKNWLGKTKWKYKAIIGRQSLNEEEEGGEYYVRKEVLHPEYFQDGEQGVVQLASGWSSLRIDNDFMLIFLKKSVANDDVKLVQLNSDVAVPNGDISLTVMGWGDTVVGEAFVQSNTLLEARGRAIPNDECLTRRGKQFTYEGAITPRELCVDELSVYEYHSRHQGMCSGDSGGPLIVRGDSPEDDLQVGLVSWGACGSNTELPGVYARVSSRYEWIVEEVCKSSKDPPSYYNCPPRESSLPVFPIVLGSIIGIVIVAVAVASAFFVRRRKRSKEEEAFLVDTSPALLDTNIL